MLFQRGNLREPPRRAFLGDIVRRPSWPSFLSRWQAVKPLRLRRLRLVRVRRHNPVLRDRPVPDVLDVFAHLLVIHVCQ